MMLRIYPVVTAFVFVPLAIVVPMINLLGNRIATYHRQSREALGRVTGFLGESFGGILAIKVEGATPHVVARLRVLSEARRRAALRDNLFNGIVDSLYSGVVSVGTGIILLLAARAMRGGTFTVGDFALFVTYLTQITWFPDEIAQLLTSYKRAGVSVDRLAALLGGAPRARLVDLDTPFLGRTAIEPGRAHSRAPLQWTTPLGVDLLEARGLTCLHRSSRRGIEGNELRP